MIKVFLQLLRRDLTIFLNGFGGRLFNIGCWLVPNVIVFNQILPLLGVQSDYGIFVLVGAIATVGLFTSVSGIPTLLTDITDNQAIYYYLSLPLPQWLVFVRYAISFSLNAGLIAIGLLPISKLILGSTMDLSHFSFLKFLIFFPVLQLFFGFFALALAAGIDNIDQYENAWVRVVFPLWFMGGYQFPWAAMHQQLPWLSYITLANPITYAIEGFRAAVLGQMGYLNFWVCLMVLVGFTLVTGYWGVRRFVKRMDCLG
jgi:ABC-2 type transport system permease protein